LVTNGAQWVIDEIQLCQESATTLRQLVAFARSLRTAEPFGLTCMSATVPRALLDTVDSVTLTDSDMVMTPDGTASARKVLTKPPFAPSRLGL
jgi:hypothetical protein